MSQEEYWAAPTWKRNPPDSPAATACYGHLVDTLAGQIDLGPDSSILDVGTGHGPLMFHLIKRYPNVTGTDFSETMLEMNPCKGQLVQADATDLPFENDSFDLVVCSALLHHLGPEEQQKAVREMARVSRTTVALFEPNRLNPAVFLFSYLKKEERGALGLGKRRFRELLTLAGMKVASSRIMGMVLPNVSPKWYIPLGRALNGTWLARLVGFFVLTIGCKTINKQK